MNDLEQELIEDAAEGESKLKCLNWPPSRGPEPPWLNPKLDYEFPQPAVVFDGEIVRDEDEDETERDRDIAWYAVWVQVTDLLKAGPELSEKLVTGSYLLTRTRVQARVATMKYLARYHPALDEKCVSCVLDYPLRARARVTVAPFAFTRPGRLGKSAVRRTMMTMGWLLWSLARAYERIYAEHEKYGVWGHSIHDLCFERVGIRETDVFVFVGS